MKNLWDTCQMIFFQCFASQKIYEIVLIGYLGVVGLENL